MQKTLARDAHMMMSGCPMVILVPGEPRVQLSGDSARFQAVCGTRSSFHLLQDSMVAGYVFALQYLE